MKKLLFLSLIPLLTYAENLQQLVNFAMQNKFVESKQYALEASKEQEYAVKSNYLPSLSIGGSQTYNQEESVLSPENSTLGYAKLSFVIYDGGKRDALFEKHNALIQNASYTLQASQNSVALNVVYYYYTYLTAMQNQEALEQKLGQLQAENTRLEKFLSVGSATEDEIQKILSSIAQTRVQLLQNDVTMSNALNALEYLTAHKVSVQSGSSIHLETINDDDAKRYDILALEQSVENAKYQADIAKAPSRPTITIDDTYSRFNYDYANKDNDTGADRQNTIALNLQWKIFDFGSTSASYQSAFKEYLSQKSQVDYEKAKAKASLQNAHNSYAIALQKVEASKARLQAATMTYQLVQKKFQNGIVNNVAYLDALSDKYNAISELQTSRNDVEYQKAVVLFEMGKEIKGSIQ